MTTPAGWHPDPAGSGRQRYFDGATWTENFATAAPPPLVKSSGSGKTVAIVLGVVGVVLLVGFVGCAVLIANVADDGLPTSGPDLGRTAAIGEPIGDGKFEFTVTGVDEADSLGLSKPRGRFVVVDVTVKNTSNEEQTFQVNDQMMTGSNGAEYRADWVAAGYINEENTLLLSLGPGFTANYRVPFDLPLDVAPVEVELHDSALSLGATVKLS